MVGPRYQSRAGAGAARLCLPARLGPSAAARFVSLEAQCSMLNDHTSRRRRGTKAARVASAITEKVDARRSPFTFVAIHPAVGRRQQHLVAIAVVWKDRR